MTRTTRSLIATTVSFAITGCAAGPGFHANVAAAPRRSALTRQRADDPALIRLYLDKLPIGSIVVIEDVIGVKTKATLVAVEPDAIVFKPKTRVPQPVAMMPLAWIELERKSAWAKTAGIMAAVGAATFAIVFGVLVAND
jgi:hypothetical protein